MQNSNSVLSNIQKVSLSQSADTLVTERDSAMLLNAQTITSETVSRTTTTQITKVGPAPFTAIFSTAQQAGLPAWQIIAQSVANQNQETNWGDHSMVTWFHPGSRPHFKNVLWSGVGCLSGSWLEYFHQANELLISGKENMMESM